MITLDKKEKKCPLTRSDWLSLISSKKSILRTVYYSEELSLYTDAIILLTTVSIMLASLSLAFLHFDVEQNNILGVSLFLIFVFVSLTLGLIVRSKRKIKKMKIKIEIIVSLYDILIAKIVNGKITNSDKIRKEYQETVIKSIKILEDEKEFKKYRDRFEMQFVIL